MSKQKHSSHSPELSHNGLTQHEVAHHFDTADQEFRASKMGMWLFLATELMMFGGLFVVAILFRWQQPAAFSEGMTHLSWKLGLLNTFFLLTSGYTMAMSIYYAQQGKQEKVRLQIWITIALACCFLVTKTFEYMAKFEHGLLPGQFFHGHGFQDSYVHVFYGIYFTMTGLHSLHVIIGIGLMFWLQRVASKVAFHRTYYTPLEMVGLYWALVDFIWVFLFPLLYLMR